MKKAFRFLALLSAIFFVLILASASFAVFKQVALGSKGSASGNRVAVIRLEGMILDSQEFVEDLKELTDDTSVKSIVVRVNSPGGLVAPSQEIYQAIKSADEKKPVIVSLASVAASGGYYAAIGGRKIYANPGTLTASIGVIMEFVDAEKFYEWIKVRRFVIKAGKYKDIGSTTRAMTEQEREMLTGLLGNIHTQFRAAVKERRKLTEQQLEMSADGRIVTGEIAKNLGLVDELGGFEQAILEAKKQGGLSEDAPVSFPENEEGLLRRVLFGAHSPLGQLFGISAEILPPTFSSGWKILTLAPIAFPS